MSQDRLDKMDEKLDRVEASTVRTEVHISEIKDDLKYHIKRTDHNEHRILRLEKIEQWLRGATWITLGLGGILIAAVKYFNS